MRTNDWSAEINAIDEEECSALDWAAKGRHYSSVALLLSKGALVEPT